MTGVLTVFRRVKAPLLLMLLAFSGSPIVFAQTVSQQLSTGVTPLLGKASQLMSSGGDPAAAFALLSAEEDEWAGSPQFDYLLGLAAIDSGNFDHAVLALQRLLLQDPNSAAARIELGRAYYGLGDMALAQQEFEQLQALNPPPLAQQIIADYLERIRAAETAYKPRTLGYIEFEAGYNNNANGATSIGKFLQFQLDDTSRRTASGLYGIAAGGSAVIPLAPRWSMQTAVRAAVRVYPEAETIDSRQVAVSNHLQWKRGRAGVRVGGIGYIVALGDEPNSRSYSLDTSAWRPLSTAWLLRASARFGVSKYNAPVNVRDVSQRLYSLSFLRQSPSKRKMQFQVSLVGGDEVGLTDNAANERPFGRDLYGGQIASSLFLTQTLRLFVSAGWLESIYEGPFLRDSGGSGGRRDSQYTSSLALVLLELPKFTNWSLRNEYRYVENNSDISLYEYNSFQVLLTARREFE